MEKFLKGDDSGLGGMKLSSFTAKEPGQTDLQLEALMIQKKVYAISLREIQQHQQ